MLHCNIAVKMRCTALQVNEFAAALEKNAVFGAEMAGYLGTAAHHNAGSVDYEWNLSGQFLVKMHYCLIITTSDPKSGFACDLINI